MSEPFIGQLALVPYNFAPVGWAMCNGQLLPIQQNAALFSLLGTTFGGDGKVTFALPDLRGRVPISSGQGPGLQNYSLGATGGAEQVTLSVAQIPAHTHPLQVHSGKGNKTNPSGNLLANGADYSDQAANATADATAIGVSGASAAHENRQPYLALNWIISLFGAFPNRP